MEGLKPCLVRCRGYSSSETDPKLLDLETTRAHIHIIVATLTELVEIVCT